MTSDFLLDTHALIWLVEGNLKFKESAYQEIKASPASNLYISAISVWEVGMLIQRGKIVLTEPPLQWIHEILEKPRFKLAELTPEIAIESAFLPDNFHGDPADRMIVATGRVLHATLITKDQKIIDYGTHGHLKILPL